MRDSAAIVAILLLNAFVRVDGVVMVNQRVNLFRTVMEYEAIVMVERNDE